jgi:DNA-binding PucR family transcriptional regulator
MMETPGEEQIVQLATGAARSLAPCTAVWIDLDDAAPAGPAVRVAPSGGPALLEDGSAAWTFPLHSGRGHLGWLTAVCEPEPTDEEVFLLRALSQHTAAAIASRRLREQERATLAEVERVNADLSDALAALQRSVDIHARLTEVAASGEGREGIALAVHDLTGLAVAVEDRFGNLQAWAGPDRPEVYPKQSPASRERLIARVLKAGRPVHVGDRWIGVTRPRPDVIGAMALHDPGRSATDQQLIALEHGLTVLAMELIRVRSLAESELRVRRDLVEELLAGTEEDSALRRAQALRYDLERPHRVAVIESDDVSDPEALFHAVRRAARDGSFDPLLASRGAQVVLLADDQVDWDELADAIAGELTAGRVRIGVGETCHHVPDFPRSLRQADTALRLQKVIGAPQQAKRYEDLGVFQLLAEIEDDTTTEGFVRRWLAPLVDYDARRNADLVRTLSRYLECGGSYRDASASLFIHRSTLKYRLQRIREISGLDLADPDTRFNLQLACRAWQTLAALRST